MEIVIRKEDTGLNNYTDGRVCPLAKALTNFGIKEVGVLGNFNGVLWHGEYDNRLVSGYIPESIGELAYDLSHNKAKADISLTIPDFTYD